MFKSKYTVFFCTIISCGSAFSGEMPPSSTKDFCDLASSVGYPSRGFRVNSNGCSSEMVDVPGSASSNGISNNIAYYAIGDSYGNGRIGKVSIILNINNTKNKSRSLDELISVANYVGYQVLGGIPKEFSGFVKSGKNAKWQSGAWLLEIKHDRWSTGLGQDIKIMYYPR